MHSDGSIGAPVVRRCAVASTRDDRLICSSMIGVSAIVMQQRYTLQAFGFMTAEVPSLPSPITALS